MSLDTLDLMEWQTFFDHLSACRTEKEFILSLSRISDTYAAQGVTPQVLKEFYEQEQARRETKGIRPIIY